MKEHVLITIFANAGAGSVYAIHVVTVVKAFYMKNITFFVSFVVIVTTQVRIFRLLLSFFELFRYKKNLSVVQKKKFGVGSSLLFLMESVFMFRF